MLLNDLVNGWNLRIGRTIWPAGAFPREEPAKLATLAFLTAAELGLEPVQPATGCGAGSEDDRGDDAKGTHCGFLLLSPAAIVDFSADSLPALIKSHTNEEKVRGGEEICWRGSGDPRYKVSLR